MSEIVSGKTANSKTANNETANNEMASELSIAQELQVLRSHFATGQTRSLSFRKAQLKRLSANLSAAKSDIYAALKADLGKCELEAHLSELALVLGDIDQALKHLSRWSKPQRVKVPLPFQPASAQIVPEPLGLVLIISPWNYPLQLALGPLVSAIAAGNCAVIKPSEITPNTSALLAKLVADTFDNSYVRVMEGGVETAQSLLAEPFDHIFFTGSPAVGKVVMRAAAEHLTPVTLELGGKSPCIVAPDADIAVAARRIVWGKCFNAGQTCVAPDYLLVHKSIKAELLDAIARTAVAFFGEDMASSPDYGRLVSDRHFQRLQALMNDALAVGKKIVGGQSDADTRYMAFTVVDDVPPTALAMQEEIFGPLLPVLSYETIGEAIAFINQRPKPLALYLFSTDSAQQQAVAVQTSSGGLCFNETVSQYAVPDLPFGGVGQSGLGSAHGKTGFDTFSHHKSVLKKPNWLDLSLRYPPYAGKLAVLNKLL
ncbi:MAG: aldehyde dehydrogenase family protein [Cyanobacteria bacterium J06598_3]